MTLSDLADVIAARDELPYEPVDFLRELFIGTYPSGTVLEYHGFQLLSQHTENGPRVWEAIL